MTAPSSADGPRVTAAPLRVALLGLGTVGREVARGLTTAGTRHRAAAGGREVRLAAVADRDASRFEGLDLRDVECLDDGSALIGRPDIDVVVELIGGVEVAGRLVADALAAGHAVVTANKSLLARRGAELERLARDRGAALRFEAAVGGAIPVLATLAGDLAANRIDAVRGIVNGSTNFVLTEMTEAGAAYDEVVARAKSLGFLEADPSADVEGRDAADKLAILVRLAFGAWPDVAAIRRAPPALRGDGPAGITGVTMALIEAARREHLTVKLVAQATRDSGGVISAWVLPVAVPARRSAGPDRTEPRTASRSTATRSAGWRSSAQERAVPRPAARCSATCWRSRAARARRGPAFRPRPCSPRNGWRTAWMSRGAGSRATCPAKVASPAPLRWPVCAPG